MNPLGKFPVIIAAAILMEGFQQPISRWAFTLKSDYTMGVYPFNLGAQHVDDLILPMSSLNASRPVIVRRRRSQGAVKPLEQNALRHPPLIRGRFQRVTKGFQNHAVVIKPVLWAG